jgi:hypothetical protein
MPTSELLNYQIIGKVVTLESQEPINGLLVEAWDKYPSCNAKITETRTNGGGAFILRFKLNDPPNLFFKVIDSDIVIKSTEKSPFCRLAPGRSEVLLEIGSPIDPELLPSVPVVLGQISNTTSGYPVAGIQIAAHLVASTNTSVGNGEINLVRQLNETTSDTNGLYQIVLESLTIADLTKNGELQIVLFVMDNAGE